MTDLDQLRQLKQQFIDLYFARPGEVFSVGIGKNDDGELCMRVSGTEAALAQLPHEFKGAPVLHRVSTRPVVALGGQT